jgi:hypothetical protein
MTPTTTPQPGRTAFSFWSALCLATCARVVLTTTVCLLLWAAVPALWGWSPTTVVSGSMAPTIVAGDVVVAMPLAPDELVPGQVLLVDDPDRPGELRLHRLVESTSDGLRLQGDANAEADSSPVPVEDVHGVGVLLVPAVGSPVLWHGGDRVAGGLLASLAVLALIALTRLEPKDDEEVVDPLGPSRHRARPPVTTRTWAARASGTVFVVVGGVAVLLLVVGSSHSAFAGTTSTASSLATSRFACLDRPVAAQAHVAYQYNDGVGTSLRDSSGNGRTGTLTPGAVVQSGSCASGPSPWLSLDGATGQVTTPERLRAPQVFSIETWFRTTTTAGGKLVGFGNSQAGASTQYDRHLYLTNRGTLVFGVYSGQQYTMSSTASYADGAWHLATVTFDGSGMVLYVDGAQVASSPQNAAENFLGWWRIGYDTVGGVWPEAPSSPHYRGDLENTSVYDVALSAADVAAHHSAGR